MAVAALPGANMKRAQVEPIAGCNATQPVGREALALQRAAGRPGSVYRAAPLAVEGGDKLDVVKVAVCHQHMVGPLKEGPIRDLPVDGLVQRQTGEGIHGDCGIVGLKQKGSRSQPSQFHFLSSSSSKTRYATLPTSVRGNSCRNSISRGSA